MRRKIKLFVAGSIVTLSLGLTVSSMNAQDNRNDGVGSNTATTTRSDNDGFNLGWIGLAGLAGLIGLIPRDRTDRRNHTDHNLTQ